MAIRETLSLDLSPALSGLGALDARFAAIAKKFQAELAAATKVASGSVQVTGAKQAEADLAAVSKAAGGTQQSLTAVGAASDVAGGGLTKVAPAADAAGKGLADTDKSAKSADDSLKKIGTSALIAGGALALGLGVAVARAADFEKQMSLVGAVSDTTSGNLERLREAALTAGQATVFSASEAAQAEAELAKAGVSVADILGGALTGSLNLAAAGQLDLATSATITAQALKIFNLDGSQAAHVADILAAGANKSATDVQGLGEGMVNAGAVASTLGLSLEDTVGALALFADRGLDAQVAGDSLKRALIELSAPSQQQSDAMKTLADNARAAGAEVANASNPFFDAQGKFVGLAKAADILQKGMANYTDQQKAATLATLGGSFGLQALQRLYDAGPRSIREYTEAVNDQGAAQRFASAQLDNLSGDLEQLRGSLETALIQGGSQATDVLRFLTQTLTGTVNAFSELPEPLQAVLFGLTTLGATGLIAVGALGTLIPKFREVKLAIDAVTETRPRLAATLTGIGAFGTVAGVFGGAAVAGIALASALGQSATGLQLNIDKIQGLTRAGFDRFAQQVIEADGALGGEITTHKVFNDLLEKSPQSAQGFIDALDRAGVNTNKFERQLQKKIEADRRGQESQEDYTDAVSGVAGVTDDAAGATSAFAEELDAANTAADNYKKTLDALLGIGLDVESANLKFRDSLEAVNASIEKNGLTLDANTEAGRNNRKALLDTTEAAIGLAEAQFRQDGNTARANETIGLQVGYLNSVAHQMGLTDEQALVYIEDLLGIPPDVRTEIHNTADLARYLTELLEAKYDDIDGRTVTTTLSVDDQATARVLGLSGALSQLDGKTATSVLRVIVDTTGIPSAVAPLVGLGGLARGGVAFGAHGLVGSPGMIVGPRQPVLIGEGLSREAVVPFDNFADMVATIRNTGHAADFARAALAAGGAVGFGGGTAGGGAIVFNIQVSGVSDPGVGKAVGRQIGAGAAEALAKRGVITAARVEVGGLR